MIQRLLLHVGDCSARRSLMMRMLVHDCFGEKKGDVTTMHTHVGTCQVDINCKAKPEVVIFS